MEPSGLTVILVFIWSTSSLFDLTGSDCEFPRQWLGRWYQTGVGEVTIRSNEISTKGICYEQFREYFLVENRREHCHQCLLIVRRHTNLIQFRESYCIGRVALQSICGQIRVEGVGLMHTLIREGALPVPCPLQRAFHFTYSNYSGGYCRSPTSYVHQCAGATTLRFSFRQCRHCSNTFEKDVEFECLATWKDGSDHYGYGISNSADSVDGKDGSYRCFMYQKIGAVVYVGMSPDSTCRGMRSPKDAPLVMELTEDVYGWPSPRCHFPSWMADSSWVDAASGQVTYAVNTANDVITVQSQRKFNHSHARAVFKCLRVDDPNGGASNTTLATSAASSDDEISDSENFTVLAHVLEKCQSKHRCLRINRRHASLIHLYLGKNVSLIHPYPQETHHIQAFHSEYGYRLVIHRPGNYVRDAKERCTDDKFSSQHSQHNLLLASSDQQGSKCPLKGRYTSSKSDNYPHDCPLELRIGCSQSERIDILSECHVDAILQLTCLFWWREHHATVLVARRTDTNMSACYSIQHQDSKLMLSYSDHCILQRDHAVPASAAAAAAAAQIPHPPSIPYVFHSSKEKCKDKSNARTDFRGSTIKSGHVVDDDAQKDDVSSSLFNEEILSKRVEQLSSADSLLPDLSNCSSFCFVSFRTVSALLVLSVFVYNL